jgi:polyhydroxyalkanoate synthesis regulator phasin
MGKDFLDELKADPIKKIDDLIDDGKDAVKKTREKRFGAVKQRVKETRTSMKKRFDTINTEKTKVVKGIENDAKLIVEEAIELGKKNIDRMPFKKNIENIEKTISKRMASLPSKLNLPSRDEIDNLVNGIDGVNKKVDSLTKQAVKV